MRKRMSVVHLRVPSRVAAILVIGGLAAGCSSDSMRFAGNPFSNPFSSSSGSARGQASEPRMTGSVSALPRATIRSEPLAAPAPAMAASPSYERPYAPQRTAALPSPVSKPAMGNSGPGGWSAQGGTAVTIAPGENLNLISNRYGVPASAILSASGLSNASQATPGRRVIIPVYNAGGTQTAAQQSRGASHVAEIARPSAKQPDLPKPIRPGQQVAKPEPWSAPRQAEPVKTAKVEAPSAQQPKAWSPAPSASKQEVPQAAKESEQTTGSLPSSGSADFRWPARGRVISGFGGNGGNEGINIAVPEGTPVKAAETGTVAYAGSEVKGYGNLVLIRHDNGFVSAYAHNGEISVKRGDKVKRGQVIAKSGQSGNVTSPQLHFELRKGSTPVDPIPHLDAN
jgi:murein DD-endopeptidase MepM/ murein hydrolase activator NlpD